MEEEKKYLDYQGLQTYHENLLSILDNSELATAEALDNLDDRLKIIENKSPYSKSEIDDLLDPITDKLNDIEEFAEVNVQSDWNLTDTTADDYIKNKPGVGVANGLATLDSTGKVPSSQLPSYVDDVIEGYYHGEEDPQSGETVYNMYEDDEYTILITPESGKIYLDIPSSNSYRWSGSQYVLIGAPYDLPVASSSTLGGIKVGSNLSIDQNGVLSAQASSPDEVQIGGNTPSSDSGIKIFIDTTEDAIAEVYTKQQQDVKFVVIKDLNAAPTESTLTYTENGTVKNFKQGDEVRVPDQDADNGYTFYKLYELTTSGNTTTATWDKLGAGGAAPVNPNETVNISLTQVSGSSADLIGAAVTITNDDTGDTLLTATWNGSTITTEIDVNTNYTVSVETIAGYFACEPQSYQAGYQSERNITFQYRAMGAYIEATDGTLYTSTAWSGSGKTANAVVVLTDVCKVRMALIEELRRFSSDYTKNLSPYLTIKTVEQAKVDYDGASNTDALLRFANANGYTDTSTYAAPWVRTYAFTYPSGQYGSIPAGGQLWTIYQNMTSVNACLTACGGTLFNPGNGVDDTYSSSTAGDTNYLYNITSVGFKTNNNIAAFKKIRPVSSYSL